MRFEKVSFEVWEKEALKWDHERESTWIRNCPHCFARNREIRKVVWENIELPKRSTKYSAGYDFFTPIDLVIHPGQTITIPTGIKWNPGDRKDTFLAIYPRSSLGRDYSLREPNIVSIIDADYYDVEDNEGHIYINLKNEGTSGAVVIPKGKAYAQGIISVFLKTDDDEVTTTRTGGFGSTN